MRIQDLDGKNVLILGFGKEGKAALAAIEQHAPTAQVTISDSKQEAVSGQGSDVTVQCGDDWLKGLDSFDVIILSPGIPPQPEFDAVKDKITNGTQIFLDTAKEKGSMVIGVTGTKGKSTTSSLIHAVLKTAGKNSWLVGNIGKPALAYLEHATAGAIFVMEMSSYQLMYCESSPHIAVVTSFFPEHLDYHGSLENYKDAKAHIARFQGPDDAVIYNGHWDMAKQIAAEGEGKKIAFLPQDAPVTITQTKLLGDHNLGNIAAAFHVAKLLDISFDDCVKAFREFEPLPHRLQSLGMHHGIEWVDDAISTTPESTVAALRALGDRVHTIILGGQDRGLYFEGLADEIINNSSVETAILFPGTGPRIKKDLETYIRLDPDRNDIAIFDAQTMEDAVAFAKQHTPEGMICLLSTASPSYNMFKNFEEKGDVFRRCVEAS